MTHYQFLNKPDFSVRGTKLHIKSNEHRLSTVSTVQHWSDNNFLNLEFRQLLVPDKKVASTKLVNFGKSGVHERNIAM